MAESDPRPGAARPEAVRGGQRDEFASAIYEGLALVVRRIRAQSARLHPRLSFTAYTLLVHLNETGGSRASELVEHYGLNKSTVSRQLAELAANGLVERELDQTDSRVQIVRINDAGRRLLTEVREVLQSQMLARLDGWSDADLAAFARMLQRYNATPRTRPGGSSERAPGGAAALSPGRQSSPGGHQADASESGPSGPGASRARATETGVPDPSGFSAEDPAEASSDDRTLSQPAGVTTWT